MSIWLKSKEMSSFKRQAKRCLRPDMLWCALQIRGKRLYSFSPLASLFFSVLREQEGKRKKYRAVQVIQRHRQEGKAGKRIIPDWVSCRFLPKHAVLIKHSLVNFVSRSIMSRGDGSRRVSGTDVDHFWHYRSRFCLSVLPFPRHAAEFFASSIPSTAMDARQQRSPQWKIISKGCRFTVLAMGKEPPEHHPWSLLLCILNCICCTSMEGFLCHHVSSKNPCFEIKMF